MATLASTQQLYAASALPGFMSTVDTGVQGVPAVLQGSMFAHQQQQVNPGVPVAPAPAVSSSSQGGYETMVAVASPAASAVVPSAAAGVPAAVVATSSGGGCCGELGREWLYYLVTFPSYFTPCPHCCGGNRTPKREQLITHFDIDQPSRVYCSHCPEHKTRTASLLQVRRSAFKDVVKALDITRFGADVAGVQQYTLNGSKVIYLNREATNEKKTQNASAAPANCTVDGRAMMDKTSLYCSLKCKMQAEDPGFTTWLNMQDPQLVAASVAAANAPPRPTIACKRAASASSAGSLPSLSSLVPPTGPRAKKAPKLAGNETVADSLASCGSAGSSAAVAAAAGGNCGSKGGSPQKRPCKGGGPSASGSNNSGSPLPALPRIRTQPATAAGLAGAGRLASAPAGLIDSITATGSAGGGLERAHSATAAASWDEPVQSPTFADGFGATWDDSSLCKAAPDGAGGLSAAASGGTAVGASCWDSPEEGSFSPKLITTAIAPHGAGGTGFDWWLPGGKPDGELAPAGSCLLPLEAGLWAPLCVDEQGPLLVGLEGRQQQGGGKEAAPVGSGSCLGGASSEGSEEVTMLPLDTATKLGLDASEISWAGSPTSARYY